MDFKKEEFKKVRNKILHCRKCTLYKKRKQPVIGEGSSRAKIMLIGEAPGFNEDQTGRPFCGRAGKILDELLKSIGLKREKIYICNILKCHPPKNRGPRKEEIKACTPYLLKQIEIIKPKVICALGNFSTVFIFEKYGLEKKIKGISKIHGRIFKTAKITIVPFFHPAVVVYNNKMKKILVKDFQILKKFFEK